MHTFQSHSNLAAYLVAVVTVLFVQAERVTAENMLYEARVAVARAVVRSGPGEHFYPTQALARGEVVEVYREQWGGWLAIRPPVESFSWVPARHLSVRGERLAEVTGEDVPSRIGSRLGNMRNAAQVQLRKGEVVEILGEERVGDETWYRIAPPAGEFRWIHVTHVERAGAPAALLAAEPPAAEATATAPPAAEASEPIVIVTTEQPPGGVVETAPQEPASIASVGPAPEQAPAETAWRAATEASAVSPPAAAAMETTPITTAALPPAPASAPAAAAGASDDLARQLADIELRLSRVVAEPPATWELDSLRAEASGLLAHAKTPADSDEIARLIAKVDGFAAIARRHQGEQLAVGSQLSAVSEAPAESRQPTADSPAYDAVGVLRPVVSRRPGAPQFALVDERGQVISFVTATPDMNLQPYIGHRVGITGSRGYIPEFQRPHVTAGRVTPITERIVR